MKDKLNLLQKLGLGLILISCVLLLGSEFFTIRNRSSAQDLAGQLESFLPERCEGDPENYSDISMPVLQLNGTDFSGLIQVPAFGISLPMGNHWDRTAVTKYPCRFWGSLYDHSLIIGGSSGKGQFDFFGRLDLGDKISVTDMTGTKFSYEVVRIDRRKNADIETLQETAYDLTLFVHDSSSLDYILVRCLFSH